MPTAYPTALSGVTEGIKNAVEIQGAMELNKIREQQSIMTDMKLREMKEQEEFETKPVANDIALRRFGFDETTEKGKFMKDFLDKQISPSGVTNFRDIKRGVEFIMSNPEIQSKIMGLELQDAHTAMATAREAFKQAKAQAEASGNPKDEQLAQLRLQQLSQSEERVNRAIEAQGQLAQAAKSEIGKLDGDIRSALAQGNIDLNYARTEQRRRDVARALADEKIKYETQLQVEGMKGNTARDVAHIRGKYYVLGREIEGNIGLGDDEKKPAVQPNAPNKNNKVKKELKQVGNRWFEKQGDKWVPASQ